MDVLNKQLGVMDLTETSLSMENKLPIIVFNMNKLENIRKAILGKPVGTYIGGIMNYGKESIGKDARARMEKVVMHLQDELRGLRTGRASPGLVENVKVEFTEIFHH